MRDQKQPIPNPEDWADSYGAAALLGVRVRTVLRMADARVLTAYRIGRHTLYWRPEVVTVRDARSRVARSIRNGAAR